MTDPCFMQSTYSVHCKNCCSNAFRCFFGRPIVKRFALCYRTVVCPVLSVTLVYCGQTVGWIKMKRGIPAGLGPGHIVLDGDPAFPPPKGHSPTQFSTHICCGQMAAWMRMPHGTEVRLGPRDIVLDGYPAPPPKRAAEPPNFRPMSIVAKRPQPRPPCVIVLLGDPTPPPSRRGTAHDYCGQTAWWIKMPLGMEVGLGPGHIVLHGDPAWPQKGDTAPNFRPMSVVRKNCH